MSDENIEDFGFPVKEGFEIQKEEVKTEEVINETPEVKTEEEVKEEVAESNDAAILEEIGEAKKEVETPTEEVKEEVKTEEVASEAPTEEIKEKLEDEPVKIDNSSLIREEISKVTDGEFTSVEEMNQAYNDILEQESGKSYLEKINDAVEAEYGEGITFSDLVEYKGRDFDNMSSIDLITEQLHLSDGEISEEEIAAEMRPFNLLKRSDSEIDALIEEEQITRDQVDDLKARLVRKSRIARTELKEFQDSIDIDNLQVSSPKVSEKEVPTISEEDKQANLERYKSVINNLSEFKINVGTKENPADITFQVTDDDRNGVTDFLSSDEKNGVSRDFIQKNWTDDEGNVDMDKLSKDMYKVINYDRDVSRAHANGKSEVSKEVKDISNIDFKKGESTPAPVVNDASQAAEMARQANS
jgi:hypothetical protein